MKNKNLEINKLKNKDVAYIIGAFQSDGCFYTFIDRKRNKIQYRLSISGKIKSLPMIKKFQENFNSNFNRSVSIQKNNRRNIFYFQTSINRLLKIFKKLEILPKKFTAPRWTKTIELFGAYLAGLIDGDGNICIKRPKYPQCRIRITNGAKQEKLAYAIQNIFNCSVSITPIEKISIWNGRSIYGKAFDLDFYVSKKNITSIKKFVYPFIQIKQKRKKLQQFFKLKNM